MVRGTRRRKPLNYVEGRRPAPLLAAYACVRKRTRRGRDGASALRKSHEIQRDQLGAPHLWPTSRTRRRRGGRDDRTHLDLASLLADESLRSPYKHINKRGPAPGMGGKVGRGADPGNC